MLFRSSWFLTDDQGRSTTAISLQRRVFYVRAEMAQNRLVRASRRSPMPTLRPRPRARNAGFSIALVALPDVAISTLTGIYEVMSVPPSMATGAPPPTFSIETVGEAAGPLQLAGGVPSGGTKPND